MFGFGRRRRDGATAQEETPSALAKFVQQVKDASTPSWDPDVKRIPATKSLLSTDGRARAALVLDTCAEMAVVQKRLNARKSLSSEDGDWKLYNHLKPLFSALLRGRATFSESDIVKLLDFVAGQPMTWTSVPLAGVVSATERFIKTNATTAPITSALERLSGAKIVSGDTVEMRKLKARLDLLIAGDADGGAERLAVPLLAGEPWADEVIAFVNATPLAQRGPWLDLLAAAFKASGTTPRPKWLAIARSLVDAIGREPFVQNVVQWMHVAGTRAIQVPHPMGGQGGREIEGGLHPNNADVLKGLIWAAASLDDPALAAPIGDLAERCYKKLPWIGPRSAKVGNAAVAALAIMSGDAPAAQLARLKQRVKQPTGARMTAKALDRFAGQAGLSVDELEERVVPTFGLDRAGARRDTFGEFTAITKLESGGQVVTSWQDANGKPRKSPPADVKCSHAAELKSLQQLRKQIDVAVAAQRLRLDHLIAHHRTWPYAQWRHWYADHPLVGFLARRLIWIVGGTPALVTADDAVEDITGRRMDVADDAQVSTWHPATHPADETLAWRRRLDTLRVVQPFKQAHREVYLLTDAERTTATYSNRFAAHILQQHRLAALCTQRGWRYRLQGGFDSGGLVPTLELPHAGLSGEFWVEPMFAREGGEDELSAAGIALHVTTDQVRFTDTGGEALPLTRIPPLVLSEVMRDVDLFVGVASVGNDPTWQDGGPEGRYRTYWENYSFGELGATAQTRRAVLETLLPRLKIRDRATLAERFLCVRGELRTYKIHLGSGNILMEPNDQYLCIVPARGAAAGDLPKSGDVFLPFEGDATLSVILSKAFLLAEDVKITDPSITRQISTESIA